MLANAEGREAGTPMTEPWDDWLSLIKDSNSDESVNSGNKLVLVLLLPLPCPFRGIFSGDKREAAGLSATLTIVVVIVCSCWPADLASLIELLVEGVLAVDTEVCRLVRAGLLVGNGEFKAV